MYICSKCGRTLSETARFCANCGAPVTPAPAQRSGQPNFSQNQPVTNPIPHQAPPPSPSQYPGYYPAGAMYPAQNPGKGFAIAGMVMGILSILNSFIPVWGPLLSVAALIFSIIGLRRCPAGFNGHGFAVAGLVCSIVGLSISIWMSIVYLFAWDFLEGMYYYSDSNFPSSF